MLTLTLTIAGFQNLNSSAEGSFDSLLSDDHLTKESCKGSICEESRLYTEESQVLDSSNELVDASEALDGPVDKSELPHPEEAHKSSDRSSKKSQ
jgi:hypothetical protein